MPKMLSIAVPATMALCTSVLGVTLSVPGDYATIQAAIDVAVDGDEILVAPGTYAEALQFGAQAIAVRSTDGPTMTIIDASGTGTSAVTINNMNGLDTVLEGFTLTGGTGTMSLGTLFGGGLFIFFSSPTIDSCIITGNTADAGGGVATFTSDAVFVNSRIIQNTAITPEASMNQGGGGMLIVGGSPTISRTTIFNNQSTEHGGGLLVHLSSPRLTNVIFSQNTAAELGGAVFMTAFSNAILVNCTIAANHADFDGGAIFAQPDEADFVISNSIIWGNTSTFASEGLFATSGNVSFSIVQDGWEGSGCNNYDVDPQFADLPGSDLRPISQSSAIDSGDEGALPPDTVDDIDGNARVMSMNVDRGAYEASDAGCAGDIDGDSVVGMSDLLVLLSQWGPCADACTCTADTDGTGSINIADLLGLISSWGPCNP